MRSCEVIRLPERRPAMTREYYQERLRAWRARKGWREQQRQQQTDNDEQREHDRSGSKQGAA